MRTWTEYYYVEWDDESDDPFRECYLLRIKGTNEVVGRYRDSKYAEKQAKYKFKRIIQNLEKTLLG